MHHLALTAAAADRLTPGRPLSRYLNPELARAQKAARRGFEALGKRAPDLTDPLEDHDEHYRQRQERRERVRLEVLDAGRSLIARAAELDRQAREAREAGVEALRHAWPPVGWRDLGELLELSGQGAHKRYRHLDGPEAELTLDDELANRTTTA